MSRTRIFPKLRDSLKIYILKCWKTLSGVLNCLPNFKILSKGKFWSVDMTELMMVTNRTFACLVCSLFVWWIRFSTKIWNSPLTNLVLKQRDWSVAAVSIIYSPPTTTTNTNLLYVYDNGTLVNKTDLTRPHLGGTTR